MKWIGLTGCMGCGKSTVADILRAEFSIPVVSADTVATSILLEDSELHGFIEAKIGVKATTLTDDDDFKNYRKKIAEKVFTEPQLLKEYEAIFHPKVKQKVLALRKELSQKNQLAFYDVPLLFEKNMQSDFDAIVGVFSDPDVQIQRIKERNNWSELEISARLKSQIPNANKIKQCDFVITNNSDLEDLEIQVRDLVAKLTQH